MKFIKRHIAFYIRIKVINKKSEIKKMKKLSNDEKIKIGDYIFLVTMNEIFVI